MTDSRGVKLHENRHRGRGAYGPTSAAATPSRSGSVRRPSRRKLQERDAQAVQTSAEPVSGSDACAGQIGSCSGSKRAAGRDASRNAPLLTWTAAVVEKRDERRSPMTPAADLLSSRDLPSPAEARQARSSGRPSALAAGSGLGSLSLAAQTRQRCAKPEQSSAVPSRGRCFSQC